jgi:acetyltransferase-like isoleucine patch superfamily enzyme
MRRALRLADDRRRRAAQRLRDPRERVLALRLARLPMNNAEGSVAMKAQAQRDIADGTLVMGTMSYYAPRVIRGEGAVGRVIVGNFASVAADADMRLGGERRSDRVAQFDLRAALGLAGADDLLYGRGDIVVGSDTWVTTGCTVLSGVTVGDGAVVGTQAVVTEDVRPYAIVVGNPAREVGRRFTDEQVEALLRIRWWDWPVDVVRQRVDALSSADVDGFIARFDPRE